MKTVMLLSPVLLVSSCFGTLPGSFCSSYLPLNMTEIGAAALFDADDSAARRAAVNEDTYRSCS